MILTRLLSKISNNCDFISSFATTRPANCISIGPDSKIYLGFKDHIEIFYKSGQLISKWDTINSIAYITSIAIDESSVFLADAGNKNHIKHFHQR